MDDRSAKYRAFFAQLICAAAKTTDPRIEQAFRNVRREPFAGPGPWSITLGGHAYVATPDDDPAFLYQNTLLALDPARGVNIGMPGAHAYWLSGCGIREGETVLQIGAGTGYYTAILAELAGLNGRVYAYEIDERLAGLARENLKGIATVELRERSGIAPDLPAVDVIYVCAGAAQPASEWLEALRPRGRLVFPLAPEGMLGGMLMITRPEQGTAWPAKFLSRAQFIGCAGLQDSETARRLAEAFATGWESVQSLRRGDAPDETCWFAGDGWWLSTAPASVPADNIPPHGDITQA
ncbi:methyltransferase [Bradyrhizobium sp. INPA01-394B]|uniref:Protein-L-isoaspartate O-methyltransferase n=1 Tax=Bradyrhizobium campsiandrae TaxID=1729892 RepID=A0ABR7UJI6_9BRAD|nr:rRNA adenine N-6-methyltransferase family protein [Bradyrhizobium campsiandrae]MBC9879657.1 methyltransferase [Bradyrhizobium campsiandrae]MBC9983612.1 methyltransferase [Bradyrhizobium campsiandrae]